MARLFLAALLFLAWPRLACAQVEDAWLETRLEEVRAEAGLVALGAVVADRHGNILGLAVTGERVKGSGDPARPEDAWHIGSNTKMLTALLYGRLVEQGRLEWGATLPELLPDLSDAMDPAWRDVTIEQVFSHRAGLPANPGVLWFLTARGSDRSPADQRTRLARTALSRPPANEVGEFAYSNLGYMIAGAVIDRVAADMGKGDYESLFLSGFVPQDEGWGFGPPPEGIEGHARRLFGGWKAQGKGLDADNPPALAPAGTLHVPLAAHARFLSQFLRPDETMETLQAPFPDAGSDYALGLGIQDRPEHGRIYTHNGSNTVWLSKVTIAPGPGLVVIINTNRFDQRDPGLFDSLNAEILDRYAPAAGGD